MAALVVIGIATTLIAREPEKSAQAAAAHARAGSLTRVVEAAFGAFSGFSFARTALVALAFVVLFKFTDALSGAMTAPFVIDLGFSRRICGHHQGRRPCRIADRRLRRRVPGARLFAAGQSLDRRRPPGWLPTSTFSWQAVVGLDARWLTLRSWSRTSPAPSAPSSLSPISRRSVVTLYIPQLSTHC